MFSVSTCWNSERHTDGAAMVEELLVLGFKRLELGHGVRVSLMPGVLAMVEKGRVQISSLHNYCPLPVGVDRASPDCFQYSSRLKSERERAVRQTKQTIDFAARLGAERVVLHGGRVIMPSVTERLVSLAQADQHLSPEYARAKTQAVIQREKLAPKFLARVKECLEPIVEHAEKQKVQLGLECRFSYEEIPSERDLDEIFTEFKTPALGYWHDFGHAQVQHNLGFIEHAEWLARFAPRLLGCHLHDVAWPAQDHRAPFTGGTVRYEKLLPLLPPDPLLVWEMSPRRTAEEIAQSLQIWKEKMNA